jgi:hypothetical protein
LVVEMRALLCRVASVFLLLAQFAETEAQASDPPRVLVVAPTPRSSVVERALPLIRGELAGEGLSAEIRDDDPQKTPVPQAAYGLLSLETNGSTTVIRAFAPGDPKPIVANIDADDAGVDAEVLAVRAVETLRAAVLQFAQAHQEGLPDAVRGFAQLPKATATPAAPKPPPPPRPRPPAQPRPARSRTASTVQAFLGPELAAQPRLTPSVGAEGGLIVGPRWGFIGAAFESTLYRSRVSSSVGHADILRRALSLELGARFRVAQAWELSTRVGVGYADYAVKGKGTPGYVGVALDHRALVTSLALNGAYYFGRALGVYLSFAGAVALDAPVVQLAAKEQSTLDRPSLTVSSGALLTLF